MDDQEKELLREVNALRKAEIEQRKVEFAQRVLLVKIFLGGLLAFMVVSATVFGLAQVDLPWRQAFFFASAFTAFVATMGAATEDGGWIFAAIPAAFVAALTCPWW